MPNKKDLETSSKTGELLVLKELTHIELNLLPGKYFPLKPLFIVYRGADLRVLHALAYYLSKNVPTMSRTCSEIGLNNGPRG